MANIINITEKNNRLELSDHYMPIVCGNSNYVLKFTFGEQWQSCKKKAAFFVVDDKQITVDFDGDECNVPVLPNGAFVKISLLSNDSEYQLATTAVKIRLEPTMAAADLSEFNQVASYLSKLIGTINKIENGNITVRIAERAENVANENLLINGDFSINQRGQTSYQPLINNQYTVDRWNVEIANTALVSPITTGINLATIGAISGCSVLRQKIDNLNLKRLAGRNLTVSCSVRSIIGDGELTLRLVCFSDSYQTQCGAAAISLKSGIVSTTITVPNNAETIMVDIYKNSAETNNVNIEYIKLEEGSYATEFSQKSYSQNLLECQRFGTKLFATDARPYGAENIGYIVSTTQFSFNVIVPTEIRDYMSLSVLSNVSGAIFTTTKRINFSNASLAITNLRSNNNELNILMALPDAQDVTIGTTCAVRIDSKNFLDMEIY